MPGLEQLKEVFLSNPTASTDSRSTESGSIFFALKGEKFDANRFAAQALENGAAWAVVDDASTVLSDRYILVPDVLLALQELASWYRSLFTIPVIAITGSNGKTTTKELITAVLERKFRVLATKGNFNNHIGLPLTLLRLRKEDEIAVIEMGANHSGEIAMLCGIARPDYGIITNIGKAHLKGFGSFEGVRKAKTELYRFIEGRGGILFVNAADETLLAESAEIRKELYGGNSSCTGSYKLLEDGRVELSLKLKGGVVNTSTKLFGSYNYVNLLCAACIGSYFGVNAEDIGTALATYQPRNNRSQIIYTASNTIILDAYNANPSSMELAIDSFNAIPGRNKVAILGDMLELGDEADREHRFIISKAEQCKFRAVYLVGPMFSSIGHKKFRTFENVESLCNFLDGLTMEGSQILIKGSRGIGLEKAVESIP